MRKFCLSLILLIASGVALAQQSSQYSQYMFNGLYINPAYAGYRETWNLNTYYRSQWTSFKGGPQTIAFAVDGTINNDNVGVGLNIIHDKFGLESRLGAYVNYAYRLRVSDDPSTRLALGLGVGLVNSSFDNSGADPTDPEAFGLENTLLPDARLGIFYSSQLFFAGLGADNLISNLIFNQDNNTSKIPPVTQYYLTSGGIVPLNSDILLKPSFLLKNASRSDSRAWTLDLNAAVIFAESFTIGATYRTAISGSGSLNDDLSRPNSIIALAEIAAGPNFRIGYSFDYSLKNIQSYSGGTHEISLGYRFDKVRQRVRTPRFF